MKLKKEARRKLWAKTFKFLPTALTIFIFVMIIYAASKGLGGVRYSHSVPLGIIILLYFWGIRLEKKLK